MPGNTEKTKKLSDNLKNNIPADYTPPEVLYDELLDTIRRYHPSKDLSDIERAYKIAYDSHVGQFRKSGEPYIIHPICVAIILAQLELDKETIVAGLLHDVVEDTDVTLDDLVKEFGEEVALLVDGVTKLTRLKYKQDKIDIQAENLRKMFLAMAKDIRVILIKLADRLHNMRTLQYQSPAKQIEKSRETMDIYSPLANRLGISKIKIELDDLSMRYLLPDVYKSLRQEVHTLRPGKEAFMEKVKKEIAMHMKNNNIDAVVTGRVKHYFSIYRKMVTQNKTLDQIYDIFAARIIVKTEKDCYAALGVIHDMYKPIPGRFKDYIAMPKPNMYQSLHTTLMSSEGQPFEVQIRTEEMHKTAEYGIAAHWKYKEGNTSVPAKDSLETKLSWLRQILEWQKEMSDNKEFVDSVKSDLSLLSDTVYCFTPSGDVKNLAVGSTPIDFAYSIHSAVGNTMVGARINGRIVPIDYKIKNGDRVEIITSQNSKGPSSGWLNIVRTAQARNKIKQWFKKEFKEENIVEGRNKILQYCKGKGVDLATINKPEYLQKACVKYGFTNWDAVLAAIGHGSLKESQVVSKLIEEKEKHTRTHVSDADIINNIEDKHVNVTPVGNGHKSTILINKLGSIDVHLSKCCHPVPGDEIIGYVTKGRGITIHRTDCTNILHFPESERARLVPAEWSDCKVEGTFAAKISVYAHNRVGLLVDVSKVFTDENIDVKSIDVRTDKKDQAILNFGFDVKNKEQLAKISCKIKNVSGVTEVARVK